MPSLREKDGLSLQPLCGRSQLIPSCGAVNWGPMKGDLQDIRNRLGLLAPPCLRFIEVETIPRHQFSPKTQPGRAITYLTNLCNQQTQKNQPYYRDPYGRDRTGGQVQLMIDYQRHVPTPAAQASCTGSTKSPRLQQLRETMDEAAARREEEWRENAKIWGRRDLCEEAGTDAMGGGVAKVSPHLYQPRNTSHKSDWTKRTELALACSRKQDLLDVTVNRLQKAKDHGDIIRSKKAETESVKLSKLVTALSEKDDRTERAMKRLGKGRGL